MLQDKGCIVVIGATGRLGQIFRLQAERRGVAGRFIWQSRNRPNLAQPGRWIFWDPALPDPAQNLATAIKGATQGPISLLNLAGATPHHADHTPQDMQLANVDLVKQLIRAATILKPARMLFASSAAVYGRPAPAQSPFTETTPPAPLNAYGRSKVEMENWLRTNRPADVQTSILRIANVAGCDALLGQLTHRTGPEMVRFCIDQFASGHGPQRSYIGPASLFNVLIALMDAPRHAPIVNIASQPAMLMQDLLNAWADQRPDDLSQTFRPATPEAIETVALNTDLLQTLIGAQTIQSTPAEIVTQTIRHYLAKAHP